MRTTTRTTHLHRAALAAALVGLLTTTVHADMGDIDVHGFVGQGYMQSTDNNYLVESEDGSMQFSEIGINFAADLSDDMRVGLQLFSYDLGRVGNNEILIDWAYVDYALDERLGFRLGRIKQPSGLHNETIDIDAVRPYALLPSSVYEITFRDVTVAANGVGAYGYFDLQEGGGLDYQLVYGTNNLSRDSGVARVINDGGSFTMDSFDIPSAVAGGLVWSTPVDGLRLSGTWSRTEWTAAGPTDPALVAFGAAPRTTMTSDNYTSTIGSAEYVRGPFSATGEYMLLDGDYEILEFGVTSEFNSAGWYAQTAWRFNDWLEGSVYRSERYPDKDDKSGKNLAIAHDAFLKDWAISARFDVTSNLLVKVENHFMQGSASLLGMDNPDGTEEDWSMFVVKSSLSF